MKQRYVTVPHEHLTAEKLEGLPNECRLIHLHNDKVHGFSLKDTKDNKAIPLDRVALDVNFDFKVLSDAEMNEYQVNQTKFMSNSLGLLSDNLNQPAHEIKIRVNPKNPEVQKLLDQLKKYR